MAWICVPELLASDAPLPHGSEPEFIVNEIWPLNASWFRAWREVKSTQLQFGMISLRCALPISPSFPTLSSADSRARISALQAMDKAWQESEAAFITRSKGSLMKLEPDGCSWKTYQQSQRAVAKKSRPGLPPWGMTLDGVLYPLKPLELIISANGGSCSLGFPTPRASDGSHGGPNQRDSSGRASLAAMATWPTPTANCSTGAGTAGRDVGLNLQTAVHLWPTPGASDGSGSRSLPPGTSPTGVDPTGKKRQIGLNNAVKLWPTPTTDTSERTGRYKQGGMPLTAAVKLWPTPTVAGNYNRAGATPNSGDGLATAVTREMFPTPNLTDAKAGTRKGHGQKQLCHVVRENLPTPTASMQTYGDLMQAKWSGNNPDRPTYKEAHKGRNGGQLNPTWVEWLMGYPIGWTDSPAWAIAWFRSRRAWHLKYSPDVKRRKRKPKKEKPE